MSSLISFIATPILIHLLGKDQYGLMALLISILAPLGLLDFGVSEATVKYIAENIGRKDYVHTGRYLRSTFLFSLSTGFLGGLVIVLLARFLVNSVFNVPPVHQDLARYCLYWIGINWCVMQIRQTFTGVVTALQHYGILNIGNVISTLITIAAGLGVLFFGGDLLDLVRIQAIIAALTGLGWFIVAKRLLPDIGFFPRVDLPSFRKTLGFGFWQMLNYMGGLLGHQSERWLLGILLPVATLGYYNVGIQIVATIYLAAYKTGQVLFPAVSQLEGQSRGEEAARLIVQTNWVLTTLSISCFVPLVVFSHDLLFVWVGPEFASETTDVLRILSIGSVIGCSFAIPSFYLLGTGRPRWLAIMSFVQGSVTLIVSALLIPRIGVNGAAWGFTSGTIAHITVLILMWKRILRLWISAPIYFSATFSQYALGIILALGLSLFRNIINWSANWVLLAGGGLLCAIFCVITIFAFDSILPGAAERRRSLVLLGETIVPGFSSLGKLLKPIN